MRVRLIHGDIGSGKTSFALALDIARHLILPEVGMEGQKRLKAASVLCVGTGGLGSPLLLYLAAAGVGRLGIVDFDVVDASNLQRQTIFTPADIGRSKAEAAADWVQHTDEPNARRI